MSSKRKVSKIFTDRLSEIRHSRGLSQSDLAALASIAQPALSQYESGQRRPSFTNLKRLSQALKVSVDYLIGNSEISLPRSDSDDDLVSAVLELDSEDRRVVWALIESLRSRTHG